MPTVVFRVWLVVAVALWLYFGPKTYLDNQSYRETLQEVAQLKHGLVQAERAATLMEQVPAGLQKTRNDYQAALDKRAMLRSSLMTDLVGITTPLGFLLLFWIYGHFFTRE